MFPGMKSKKDEKMEFHWPNMSYSLHANSCVHFLVLRPNTAVGSTYAHNTE